MENYINLILWGLIALIATRFILHTIVYKFQQQLHLRKENHIKKLDQIIRYVKTERHGDIDYWFDGENNQFIAQGRTREEIVLVLKSRFPEYIFLLENEKIIAGPEFNEISLDRIKEYH